MFILSVILVIVSSYLISRKFAVGFNPIYIFLIAFAQIVLSFEVLSLFSAISRNNFLICNVVFFVIAIILSVLNSKIGQMPKQVRHDDMIKALKQDKALMFLSICFILFIIFQLIKVFFFR